MVISVLVTFPTDTGPETICTSFSDPMIEELVNRKDLIASVSRGPACTIYLSFQPKLAGGKGGFGKLLRAQKNIGKHVTNFDSTRDLEGRRLRVAKKDERLEEWRSKKEREEKSKSSKSLETDDKKSKPVVVLDDKYVATLSRIEQEKADAVRTGLQSIVSGVSLLDVSRAELKPKKMLMFDDEDSE